VEEQAKSLHAEDQPATTEWNSSDLIKNF